jgi:hypothetical protein
LGKTLKKTIMGYGMKYTKGGFPFKSSPAKQKVDPDAPGTPGTPGYEPEVTSMDYLRKKPSMVATDLIKKEYNQSEEEQQKESDEETKRINTTPNTTPPMFSGAKAHNIAANITEGSIESQNLRRKENEKKKN